MRLPLALLATLLLITAPPGILRAQEPDNPPDALCPDTSTAPLPDALPMLALVNGHRRGLGLPELEPRESLMRAAALKASDLAAGGAFEHDSAGQTAGQRAVECGFPSSFFTSEALVVAGGDDSDAGLVQYAFETLLASPPHRSRIEHPDARWAGAAAARDPAGLTVWVLVFGGETSVAPADEP
jgi:uncharacterized protein YkwD